MEKLSEIQKKLKAPKGQFNEFGKYHYRSCEDILEAVKPLLNGCQLTISDRIVQLGNRYYVEATAVLSDGNKNVSVTAFAREQESKKGMDESQITGSASSYARKYALNGLFLIDDTKDADTMDNTKPQKHTPNTDPVHIPKTDKPGSKEMSSKQWNFIKKIGTEDFSMDESDIINMVQWKAQNEKIEPRHWKMAKLLLPKENFEQVYIEYSEFMSGGDIPY